MYKSVKYDTVFVEVNAHEYNTINSTKNIKNERH